MSRQEAIKIFNTVLFFGKCDASKEEIEECLKMAIQALEEQENPNSIRINFVGEEEAEEFNEYLKNQQEPILLTNGDVIKAMFPSMNIQERNNITLDIRGKTVEFTGMALREWWNAPYKAESEDKE